MTLKMLPNTINNYRFSADDIEILLVAALLHDYDPLQFTYNGNSSELKIMVTLNKDPIFVHQ